MLCAISGEAPQAAVASRKSGNVFEKRLIEEYIAQHGKDPVTGEELTTDDLVELKTSRIARPRPPTLTSIPSLLGVFQEEWDALALETYTLRQTLSQTRQELSTALYQHDAAVRVIARLRKERDEARAALSKVSVGATRAAPASGDAMQVDTTGLPAPVVSRIEETQEKLSKTRRKRTVPEDWATSEVIQGFKPSSTSEPLYPGAESLSLNSSGDLVLLGGADGVAGIYSLPEKRVVTSLKGGGGSIKDTAWVGDRAVIATSTGAVKVFEDGSEVASFTVHAGEATALSVHPTGDIIASIGVDKSYVLYDLTNMSVSTQVFSDAALTCVQFHPDGHLIAAGGMDGQIKIFDVKTGANAATFTSSGPLKGLFFSENGTWLASVAQGSTAISVWDLRKAAIVKTLEVGTMVDSICWDYTGQFLVAGGPNGLTVQQYSKSTKSWTEPLRTGVPAVGVVWAPAAKAILALSADGILTPNGESSNVVAAEPNTPANTEPRVPPFPFPQARYPGDGFDFRRPVMSTSMPTPPTTSISSQEEDVIDLTHESDHASSLNIPAAGSPGDSSRPNRATRGPRFGRNIMADVVDLEVESPPSDPQQQHSPEVQFLGSFARRHTANNENQRPGEQQESSLLSRSLNLMSLLRDLHRPGQPSSISREEIFRREIAYRTRNFRGFRAPMEPMWVGTQPQEGIDLTIDVDNMPINLDYSATGFAEASPARRRVAYVPPPTPPAGFTGTVREDDVVVCPNCEHELGTGDDPEQRQIWVSKPCGHVRFPAFSLPTYTYAPFYIRLLFFTILAKY
ncbi:hypothetical protein FQN57_001247 [Myotisia sp. PD_48]|nr:hypothetical protein FQN57_001247 [Myotisia sp. PD_48]